MSHGPRAGGVPVDFAKLYAELGIDPDCGMDAFKRAYRRRVAELHPDRPAASRRNPDLLIALNLGYAAVLDFHRSQGRIPGAAPPPSEASVHGFPPTSPAPLRATSAPAAPASRRSPRIRVLLLPVLLIIAAIWHWLPDFDEPPPDTANVTASTKAPAPALARVQLGMDADTVIALLGEPVSRDASRSHWIYGPSWLRFECGHVADWYSSPLRPLSVASRTPGEQALVRHAATRRPCAPAVGTAMHDPDGGL